MARSRFGRHMVDRTYVASIAANKPKPGGLEATRDDANAPKPQPARLPIGALDPRVPFTHFDVDIIQTSIFRSLSKNDHASNNRAVQFLFENHYGDWLLESECYLSVPDLKLLLAIAALAYQTRQQRAPHELGDGSPASTEQFTLPSSTMTGLRTSRMDPRTAVWAELQITTSALLGEVGKAYSTDAAAQMYRGLKRLSRVTINRYQYREETGHRRAVPVGSGIPLIHWSVDENRNAIHTIHLNPIIAGHALMLFPRSKKENPDAIIEPYSRISLVEMRRLPTDMAVLLDVMLQAAIRPNHGAKISLRELIDLVNVPIKPPAADASQAEHKRYDANYRKRKGRVLDALDEIHELTPWCVKYIEDGDEVTALCFRPHTMTLVKWDEEPYTKTELKRMAKRDMQKVYERHAEHLLELIE